MAKTNSINFRFFRAFSMVYWLFSTVTITADGVFSSISITFVPIFRIFHHIELNVSVPETKPNSTNKFFTFKPGVKVTTDQIIFFDNGYIFHPIYEYMHVVEINIFTRVFHQTARDYGFLIIKKFEIFYFLGYPFFTTTPKMAVCPVGFWKRGGPGNPGGRAVIYKRLQNILWLFGETRILPRCHVHKWKNVSYSGWIIPVVWLLHSVDEKSRKVCCNMCFGYAG